MEYLIHAKAVYDSDKRALSDVDGVRVRDGLIAELAPFAKLRQASPTAEVLDLPEQYLFPGLINTHVHLQFDATPDARIHYLGATEGTRLLLAVKNAQALLYSGVTTIRDAGSSWALLDLLREEAQGLFDLPRMQFSGPPLTVTGGHMHFFGEETDDMSDMVRNARLRQKRGCAAVKLVVTGGQMTPGSLPERVSFTAQEIRAVVDEAHRLGLPTFAHCLTTDGYVACMEGGVDSVEHIACFKRNSGNHLLERVYEPSKMELWRGDNRHFMMGLSAGYHNLDAARFGERPATDNEAFWLEQETRMFDIFKQCVALGHRPVCGTDAGTGGTYFDETASEPVLMVRRAGLSPEDAIHASTLEAAECLGLQDQTGKIAVGYSADLIAMPLNPLEAVEALQQVETVVCKGKIVKK